MIALSRTRYSIILLYHRIRRMVPANMRRRRRLLYILYRRLLNFPRALIRSLGICIIYMMYVWIYGNRCTWEKVILPMNFSRPILLCAFRIKTHTHTHIHTTIRFSCSRVCIHIYTFAYIWRRRELKEMCCRSPYTLYFILFFTNVLSLQPLNTLGVGLTSAQQQIETTARRRGGVHYIIYLLLLSFYTHIYIYTLYYAPLQK